MVRFESESGCFFVEFACSPRVCAGLLRTLRFPPKVQNMQSGGRLIGDSKLPVGVNVSVGGLYMSALR